jgi:hypothetical protein
MEVAVRRGRITSRIGLSLSGDLVALCDAEMCSAGHRSYMMIYTASVDLNLMQGAV